MPNHRMTSGISARCGMLRSICSVVSSQPLGERDSAVGEAEREADAAADQRSPISARSVLTQHVAEQLAD